MGQMNEQIFHLAAKLFKRLKHIYPICVRQCNVCIMLHFIKIMLTGLYYQL
jgi:hypothetical protein